MPLSELPMPVMFMVFLLLFMLVGIYPAWKRTAAKIREFIKNHAKAGGLSAGDLDAGQSDRLVSQPLTSPLNDFEIMVLRRLAQDGAKGLTRKQIDADLFLGLETVKEALQSLLRRGLIHVAMTILLSVRFYLTEEGHAYALDHEFIPRIQDG